MGTHGLRAVFVAKFLALSGLIGVAIGPSVWAGEVTVAVAANVAGPMQKIATLFAQDTGHVAKLAVGSTGKLYAQIQNGAPFDVLLAADDETPLKLEQDKRAVSGTRFTYAIGRLALWSPQPQLVDAQGEVLQRLLRKDATTAETRYRLALADPRLAPYGAAALQVLQRLNLRQAWRDRTVQGESVAQAWQFVATGNAALGFVALSQVWVDGRLSQGSLWVVPEDWHDILRQDAVLLMAGQHNPAARAWLDYLRSDKARAVLRQSGYSF
jgi:molybdate transport system substrate-binding protein